MPTLLLVDVPADMVPGSLTVTARREGKAGTETLTVREVSRPEDVAEVLKSAAWLEQEAARWQNEADCKRDEYPTSNSWEVDQARQVLKAASDLRTLAAGFAARQRELEELRGSKVPDEIIVPGLGEEIIPGRHTFDPANWGPAITGDRNHWWLTDQRPLCTEGRMFRDYDRTGSRDCLACLVEVNRIEVAAAEAAKGGADGE